MEKANVVISIAKENLHEREAEKEPGISHPKSAKIILNLSANDKTNHEIVNEARQVMRCVGHAASRTKARAVHKIGHLHNMKHAGNFLRAMGEVRVHDQQIIAGGYIDPGANGGGQASVARS